MLLLPRSIQIQTTYVSVNLSERAYHSSERNNVFQTRNSSIVLVVDRLPAHGTHLWRCDICLTYFLMNIVLNPHEHFSGWTKRRNTRSRKIKDKLVVTRRYHSIALTPF